MIVDDIREAQWSGNKEQVLTYFMSCIISC